MIGAKITQRGGKKLDAYLKNAGKGGVQEVLVGVRGRYPDGTHIAEVAAIQEFGTQDIPSRPALRSAIEDADDELRQVMRQGLDPRKMIVDTELAQRMGNQLRQEIRRKIENWTQPPNAPGTVEQKGKNDPLVDTGRLRDSVQVEVGEEDTVSTPTAGTFRQLARGRR